MTTAMTVNFRGAVLFGVQINDTVYISVKPIADAMGINWEPQRQRLQCHAILSKGTSIIKVPSARGGEQDTLGLKLSLVNGGLFGIEASRIKNTKFARASSDLSE